MFIRSSNLPSILLAPLSFVAFVHTRERPPLLVPKAERYSLVVGQGKANQQSVRDRNSVSVRQSAVRRAPCHKHERLLCTRFFVTFCDHEEFGITSDSAF